MAAKSTTPAYMHYMQSQMTEKLYNQPPKSSIKPPARNPITQEDIEQPQRKETKLKPCIGSPPKTQGIAMGQFAAKSKRSDIFGAPIDDSKASRKYIPHSNSETYIPPQSLKKSEYQPPSRNPITQDTLPDNSLRIRTKISESSAFAHLTDGQTTDHRPRDNIYYEHMKRNVFEQDEVQQKRLSKEAQTYSVEVGRVLCHDTKVAGVANDPNKNMIESKDLMQRRTLEANAKVYSARRNESNITF